MNYNYGQKSKIGWVILIAILIIGGGALVWYFLGDKILGAETITCSKKSKYVDQTVSATYKKEDLTKVEYTFKFNAKEMDKANISDKGDNLHFSYSTDDGLTSSPDEADVLVAMMIMLALSEYDGKSGISYSDDGGSNIRTVNFVADFAKASADLKEELTEGDEGPESFRQAQVEEGFICSKK